MMRRRKREDLEQLVEPLQLASLWKRCITLPRAFLLHLAGGRNPNRHGRWNKHWGADRCNVVRGNTSGTAISALTRLCSCFQVHLAQTEGHNVSHCFPLFWWVESCRVGVCLSGLPIDQLLIFLGYEFNSHIESIFKDRQIEDLWVPYFCITTDISNCKMRVHTSGKSSFRFAFFWCGFMDTIFLAKFSISSFKVWNGGREAEGNWKLPNFTKIWAFAWSFLGQDLVLLL